MSSSAAHSTKRRLLKLASLGLAGLLAGLLTGCTDTLSTSSSNEYPSPYSDYFRPATPLPESLDATQIPALHHPPSSRRLQEGSLHTVSQSMAPNGRNRS
jgi:hypothetical protein